MKIHENEWLIDLCLIWAYIEHENENDWLIWACTLLIMYNMFSCLKYVVIFVLCFLFSHFHSHYYKISYVAQISTTIFHHNRRIYCCTVFPPQFSTRWMLNWYRLIIKRYLRNKWAELCIFRNLTRSVCSCTPNTEFRSPCATKKPMKSAIF